MDILGIKQRLKEGECFFGPFIRTTDPVITEIMGFAGFDFAILDTEHGPMGLHQAENLVRSARISEMAPIIRVRENSETMITRALDTGAAGVQIPQINTADDARKAINASKFHPYGDRGVCRFTRNAEYSNIPKEKYFKEANENTLVILQIEGILGARNIDEILDVPGIDVLFIGPYDLSQSLGLTGQVTHKKVMAAIEDITKKARDKGIAVGSFADNIETISLHRSLGIQYLSSFIDTGLIYEVARNINYALRSSNDKLEVK